MDGKMAPQDGWLAFIHVHFGQGEEIAPRDLMHLLDEDRNAINASKAILNACGLDLEKPLEYDGTLDDAFLEAIGDLALAAGVDLKTGAIPAAIALESRTVVQRAEMPGSIVPVAAADRIRDSITGAGLFG